MLYPSKSNQTEGEMSEAIERKILGAFAKAAALRAEAKNGGRGSGLSAEDAERDADTALAVAQRLAAKHSIDLEALRQKDKAAGKKVSQPTEKRFYLKDGSYIRARCNLASRIAISMGLRTRLATSGRWVLFTGFPEDIEMAWQIFGLVETQMMYACDLRVKSGAHKLIPDYDSRTGYLNAKTYRLNYFDAYVNRVATRIFVSREEAQEEVVFAEGVQQDDGTVTGRVTGALVLASRKDEVEAFFAKRYPVEKYKNGKEKKQRYWQAPKSSVYSPEAREAGRHDGARANISPGKSLGNDRRAIV